MDPLTLQLCAASMIGTLIIVAAKLTRDRLTAIAIRSEKRHKPRRTRGRRGPDFR